MRNMESNLKEEQRMSDVFGSEIAPSFNVYLMQSCGTETPIAFNFL